MTRYGIIGGAGLHCNRIREAVTAGGNRRQILRSVVVKVEVSQFVRSDVTQSKNWRLIFLF